MQVDDSNARGASALRANGSRQAELERYGRVYAEHGLAVVWTVGLDGDDAKKVTSGSWQTTQPDRRPEFAAAVFKERGQAKNPAVTARTSQLILCDCDTPEGLEEITALRLPPTWTVQSSLPYKRHFWFRPPADATTLPKVGFRWEEDGFSGDVNRYLVAPPAIHPGTGEPYAFLPGLGPGEIELAEMPADVYARLVARAAKANEQTKLEAEDPELKIRPGRRRDSVFRHACMQRRWGLSQEAIEEASMRFNLERCEPPLSREQVNAQVKGALEYPGGDELAAATSRDTRLENFAAAAGDAAFKEVMAAVRGYLELSADEAVAFAVALAVAAARDLDDEEPLWLMLVGASGSGKSEAIRLLKHCADGRVDELTRAGLLSWTPGKKPRRAGLLTRVPPISFVTISDFSTVVTMGDREARARMFGALRVIYDGRLYRSIGGQPSSDDDSLEWEGHLTLLAAATTAVDTHFSFEAALGERWLLYRLAETPDARALRRTRYTVNREEIAPLREHAQELAAGLVHKARSRVPRHLSDESKDVIVKAAFLAAHARTGVQFEGNGRYRVPIGYPMPEEPMRLAGQLHRLGRCLVALGIDERLAVRIAAQAARDSIPLARFKALRHIAETEFATVASAHRAIGRGNRWGAKWELTALESIGMVDVEGPDEFDEPSATRLYRLAGRYRKVYESVGSFFSPLSYRDENDVPDGEHPTDSYTPDAA